MICVLQEGVSPLYIASEKDHTGIVQVLLDHGAQPNILTKVAVQYRHAVYDHTGSYTVQEIFVGCKFLLFSLTDNSES